jgi:hypothetical protein
VRLREIERDVREERISSDACSECFAIPQGPKYSLLVLLRMVPSGTPAISCWPCLAADLCNAQWTNAGNEPIRKKKKTHSVNPTRQLQSELGHLSNLICKIYLERRYENVQAADGIGFALEPLLEG